MSPWTWEPVSAQTYDDARYDDSIDYAAPLDLPLAPEDEPGRSSKPEHGAMNPRQGPDRFPASPHVTVPPPFVSAWAVHPRKPARMIQEKSSVSISCHLLGLSRL